MKENCFCKQNIKVFSCTRTHKYNLVNVMNCISGKKYLKKSEIASNCFIRIEGTAKIADLIKLTKSTLPHSLYIKRVNNCGK